MWAKIKAWFYKLIGRKSEEDEVFGLEVFDENGGEVITLGIKYMKPIGEGTVPARTWFYGAVDYGWRDGAKGSFQPNVPAGEQVWVLSKPNSTMFPRTLEFNPDTGLIEYEMVAKDSGSGYFSAESFDYSYGVYA